MTFKKLQPKNELKTSLGKFLRSKIVNQDQAIASLVQSYARAQMGDTDQPRAVTLLLGPTGVGKTALIEAFTEFVLGEGVKPLKLNCGEFSKEHDVTKLSGPNPGYLGFGEAKPFFSKDRFERYDMHDNLCQVLLIDEIEKAHEALFDLLLGIFDRAEFRNAKGELIDFKHVYIFCTSNLGAREMASELQSRSFGFAGNTNTADRSNQIAIAAAKKHFRPEFFNRFQHVIVCNSLDLDALRAVLEIEIARLNLRFAKHSLNLQFEAGVKEQILSHGYDAAFGARHLQRALDHLVVRPLATALSPRDRGTIYCQANEGKISFELKTFEAEVGSSA